MNDEDYMKWLKEIDDNLLELNELTPLEIEDNIYIDEKEIKNFSKICHEECIDGFCHRIYSGLI